MFCLDVLEPTDVSRDNQTALSLLAIRHHKCFHSYPSANISCGFIRRAHAQSHGSVAVPPLTLGGVQLQHCSFMMLIVTCVSVNDCAAIAVQRQRLQADVVKRVSGVCQTRRLGPQRAFRVFVTFQRVHLRAASASYRCFLGAASSRSVQMK